MSHLKQFELIENVTSIVANYQNQWHESAIRTLDILTSSTSDLDYDYFAEAMLTLETTFDECAKYYRALNAFLENAKGYEFCTEIASDKISDILQYVNFELSLCINELIMLKDEHSDCGGHKFCEQVIYVLIEEEISTINMKLQKYAIYVKEMFDEIEDGTFYCYLTIDNALQILISNHEYCKQIYYQ